MEVSTTTTTDPTSMYNFLNSWILNPVVIVIIVVIVVAYIILFSGLGNKQNANNNISIGTSNSEGGNAQKFLGIIVIIILAVLLFANAFQYFFNISITAYVENLFSPNPQIDIVVNQDTYQPTTVPEIKFIQQVFNVPGNYYTYKDAQSICSAYGADLATYEQIEDSYNKGGEWCNYGWSANQLALFPTQQDTYNNLQTIKGHENDCGRPGINGGYIANPDVRFGINCYGNKPKINSEEQELMENTTPYPETQEEIDLQNRVNYWKNKVDDILVSPFNYNTWSEL